MDERPGDTWARPTELSATDERILDFIREGLKDAEIAVRVGTSTGDARVRIERLAARLGVDGRAGLKTARIPVEPPPRHGTADATPDRRWPRFLLAGASLLGLAALAGAVVVQADRSGSNERAARQVTSGTPANPTPVPATATPRSSVVNVDGQVMHDLGQLFAAAGGLSPVISVEPRADLAVVTLAPHARIVLDRGRVLWRLGESGRTGLTLFRGSSGRAWRVDIRAADEGTTFERALSGPDELPTSVAIYRSDPESAPTTLLIWATSVGNARADVSERYHVEVSTWGDVLISERPLDPEVVIDWRTGYSVDVPNDALRLEWFLMDEGYNLCDAGGCEALVNFASLTSTLDAEYRCAEAEGVIELGTGGFTLRLERQPGQEATGCHLTNGTHISPGDSVGLPGWYYVQVTGLDGTPRSVALSEGGQLVVGTFHGTGGCPCRAGPR